MFFVQFTLLFMYSNNVIEMVNICIKFTFKLIERRLKSQHFSLYTVSEKFLRSWSKLWLGQG